MQKENYSTEKFPKEYYSFESYNSKMRMLTYWYQLSEILSSRPESILEIGVGSGLVTGFLRHLQISVKTVDINVNLNPDFAYSVLDLERNKNEIGLHDIVACSRVLHHIEFENLGKALENIYAVTKKYAVVTLPVDEARVYFLTRYTSSPFSTFSIKFPLFLKNFYTKVANKEIGSGLWQINSSSETSLREVNAVISEKFSIIKGYQMPEDKSHYMYLLEKK